MKNNRVTVLDIGSSKIVALGASTDDAGRLRIDALAQGPSQGIRKGGITDVHGLAGAIMGVTGKLARELGEGVDDLTVNLSGAHLQSLSSQGFTQIVPSSRTITRQDVHHALTHSRGVVMPAGKEQIAAIPREFRLDQQRGIPNPIGLRGGRLDVLTHLVVAQSSYLSQVEEVVIQAGHKVTMMVPEPLASGLGVLSEEAMELGAMVIDIGDTTTGVALFEGGSVAYLAIIPIGSFHASNDVAQLIRAPFSEADRLKLEHGIAMSSGIGRDDVVSVRQDDGGSPRPMQRKVLCEIIESRMREIAEYAAKHLELSGVVKLSYGVVLTGGGAQLSGCDALFQAVLGTKTRVAHPKVQGNHSRHVGQPSMATAVGLARYALDSEESEFIPASGSSNGREIMRTLKAMFGGR
ncbi:MAG: cell division protein FtsA [Fimbriimonadaceae bacterium]|jgi:cell division protein FtsA|nr:cell division protein FtsA [Fimbriimonadaceae bacterium]